MDFDRIFKLVQQLIERRMYADIANLFSENDGGFDDFCVNFAKNENNLIFCNNNIVKTKGEYFGEYMLHIFIWELSNNEDLISQIDKAVLQDMILDYFKVSETMKELLGSRLEGIEENDPSIKLITLIKNISTSGLIANAIQKPIIQNVEILNTMIEKQERKNPKVLLKLTNTVKKWLRIMNCYVEIETQADYLVKFIILERKLHELSQKNTYYVAY